MATALTATPQPSSTPPSVLLNVTGAPSPPATAYTSNFSAGVDSWATSGTGNTLTQDTGTNPVIGRLRLLGNPGPATATRTVTGLTVSAPYRLRMSYYTSAGQMRPGVTGMTPGPWVSGGSPGFGGSPTKYVTVDYLFTATATSHVITVDAQKATSGTASVYFHTVTVTNVSTWQGTRITRTDVNGTAVPVRNPTALDTAGGTMALTDYEPALTGVITYTVTDGAGATATATTSLAESRRNYCTSGSCEFPTLPGWVNMAGVPTITRSSVTPYSGTYRLDGAGDGTGVSPRVLYSLTGVTAGQIWTISARMRKFGTWPTGGTTYVVCRMNRAPSGFQDFATFAAYAPDVDGWQWVTATGVVPSDTNGTAYMGFGFSNLATVLTSAGSIGLDEVLVELAPTGGTYFDGSTPASGATAYAWLGTAFNSASIQTSPAGAGVAAPSLTLPTTGPPPTYATITALTDYGEAAESQGTVHVILGRTDKLSNPGTLMARTGTLELLCLDYDDATAMRDLLKNAAVAFLRQSTFPGMDLYFIARGVSIAPAEPSLTRHWVCTVAYDEVPRP